MIKNVLAKSIDYLTLMSYRHAHNLVINEEKAIIKSLRKQYSNTKPNISVVPNISTSFDEIKWLHEMSIKQSMN